MKYIVIILLLLGCRCLIFAQASNISMTIQPIALLDIEPDNSIISFAFGNPAQAGNSISVPANNDIKRLNITSVVAVGVTRRIDVMMVGSLGNGIRLRLQTTGPTASAVGNVGSISNADLYISNLSQTIISNIGGGHTTNGTNRGFRFNYSIEIQDFRQLKASNQSVQIVYTLSEN